MTKHWTKRVAILAMVVGLVGWRSGSAWEDGACAGELLDVDYGVLVSRADLVYDRPVSHSEEGMPLGNGRMGSLVWTAPTALRLQIKFGPSRAWENLCSTLQLTRADDLSHFK
jgi:hypothetical protein